jgi:HCO3- transporter family
MIRRNNGGNGSIQQCSNSSIYKILSLIGLLSLSFYNNNSSKNIYFSYSLTTITTSHTLLKIACRKQQPFDKAPLLQFHQQCDNILRHPSPLFVPSSSSSITLKSSSSSSSSNINSNTDNINFSPKYLEQIDKYRGYRRKIMTQKYYNTTATNTKAATTTDASPAALTPSSKLRQHVLNIINFFISDAMKDDLIRRRKVYVSDWTDAFRNKRQIVPAILFLYFACLAPAVSFGTIASQITFGSMGIVEFLLSAGVSGVLYSILCGQPMAFIAPTGLTLAFISGLYRFCSVNALPFFPIYSWVGLWTSFFFILLGLGGSSQWIRFCTRFTDEVFNALLSVNFIYEASASLKRNFQLADPENLTMPFVSLAMALTTFWSTMKVATFDSSKFLNQKLRTVIKDFGPVTIFMLMTILNQQQWLKKFNVPTLTVASTFQLAGGRNFLVDLNAVPITAKVLCAFPAVLLTALFFMDQNISVRVVNNPDNKLKKGSAYNLDMVALGFITGLISLVGLPWMCGATVQSMNHVRAMTESRYNELTGEPEIVKVTETRVTGFVVHALMIATLGLLPLLGTVPSPVVSGVFLFLGRKLMSGNSFLQRIRDSFVESSRLPSDHPILFIGRKKTTIFTIIQIACLIGLWKFKQNSATSIFFPSVIGFLMFLRWYILPKFFTERELIDLGDPTPS